MDNLQKQSNKVKKKHSNRRNRKKMQPDLKALSAASGGREGASSRKNSGSLRPGGGDDTPRPDETTSDLQCKQSTMQTQFQEPSADPTSAATVPQITGHAAPKMAGPAQAFGPGQNASSAATALPPCRPLHSCPTPWRPGEKTAPVQLKNSANSNETHHRTILAILNRITDTKMELLLNRSISLILPLHSSNNNFLNNVQSKATARGESLPLVEPASNYNLSSTGNATVMRGTSEEERSKLVTKGKVSEAAKRVDERKVGTDNQGPPGGQWNIKGIRKDFVSMLLEKAQEEEMYTREYSWFLRGLCAAIEVEADCAQLALERVQERWGEAVLLGKELKKEEYFGRQFGEDVVSCAKTPTIGKEKSLQRPKGVGAGLREETEGTDDDTKGRGKRKGAVSNDNQGKERDHRLKADKARSECPEHGSEYGQSCIDSERNNTMTLQSSHEIEFGESVCDITKDNALDTCSNKTNNEKTFCDTSSFCEIIPSEAELNSFLSNSSLKKESRQISCCGAYGDLSRFRTVIRHRALYRELFTQGPTFRELISTEALLRFNVLYGSLRQLYAGHTPWDEDEERHVRRRLKNHLRLMVLLHLSTLLPLASLELVRNTLAGPLENPAAAAPFAGGLAWGALNPPFGEGVMPPQPPQNAQEGVDDDNQNVLIVANVYHQADGAVQLPQQEDALAVAAEGLPQHENEPLANGVPFEEADVPADIAQMNNRNHVASNNLNALVAVNDDPSNANHNHIENFNDANVNNLNNVDVNNHNNDDLIVNNINNDNNLNNNNVNNNENNIQVNLNNLNNINNLNNVNNMNTSGASLLGMSAELLSFYLTTAGHINLRDRARTDEVCDLLQQTLPHLSSRQTFLVVTVLELQQRGWTEVKAPDRSG